MSELQDHYLNPFDDTQGEFLVLKNAQGEYSLWPTFKLQPLGWSNVYGPSSREACLEYVTQYWQSIQPFQSSVLN